MVWTALISSFEWWWSHVRQKCVRGAVVEDMPPATRFYDFIGDGKVYRKCKDTVLTGSASSIKWHTPRPRAVRTEGAAKHV
jgi:hypothetical protein